MRKARYILKIILEVLSAIIFVCCVPFVVWSLVDIFVEIPEWFEKVVDISSLIAIPFCMIALGVLIALYALDKRIRNSYGECTCAEREKRACCSVWFETLGYCKYFECEHFKEMRKEQIAAIKEKEKTYFSERSEKEEKQND